MNYLNEETLINAVQDQIDYQNMIEQLKLEVNEFNFVDDPTKLSGWGHQYFCQKDGGRLLFDINKPHTHVCETCGEQTHGELYDQVWVCHYRNAVGLQVWKSAFLFNVTKEKQYLKNVTDIIGFYADHYLEFDIHDKNGKIFESTDLMNWGSGRLMPQGLNESIIIIRFINALEMVKEHLEPQFIDHIYHHLFKETFSLLKPQVNKVHNICCWKNSAIGVMGLFFKDQEMIDFAFEGAYNIRKQIREGVTEDGFWYEGSIHYNFFTLEGIVQLLLFSHLYHYDFGKEQLILENMLKSAYHYAFDNHVFPNPNDGWPNINLKTYSYVYTVATKVFGSDSEVANLLKNIENKDTVRGTLPLSRPYYFENRIPLERIMLIPDLDFNEYTIVPADSRNFEASQFAIVRKNDINVFLKYGHRGPSHAHPDKMTIEVMIGNNILTKDLSNSGYGAVLSNEWYRMSASHNTVVVNGKNQISMLGGETIEFSNHVIEAKVNDVYSIEKAIDIDKMKSSMNNDEIIHYFVKNLGMTEIEAMDAFNNNPDLQSLVNEVIEKTAKIDYRRRIEIVKDGFIDRFEVSSDRSNNYDYFFHSEAKLLTSLSTESATLGYNENGYQHIMNVRKIISNEPTLLLNWQLGDLTLESNIDLSNKTCYIVDTYDNPASETRKTVVVRFNGQSTIFEIVWSIK